MTSIRFSYLKLLIFKFFKERKEIMKRRVLAILLTAAMTMGMVAGCATSGAGSSDSGSDESSDGEVTLKFLNKYPEEP